MLLQKIKIYILALFFLSGCAKRRGKTTTSLGSQDSYQIYVEGVECTMCAMHTAKALEDVVGVRRAEFVCHDDKYKNCYAKAYMQRGKSLDLRAVKNSLDKEGFALLAVEGFFVGRVIDGKLVLPSYSEKISVIGDLPKDKKRVKVFGSLDLQKSILRVR